MLASDSISSPSSGLQSLNLLKLPAECRRPFEGENGRKTDRFGERELERLNASIRTAQDTRWIKVALRDFSQTGFGMVALGTSRTFLPTPGQVLDLRIEAPWGQSLLIPCEVRNVPSHGDGLRLGVERLDVKRGIQSGAGRLSLETATRVVVRIDCGILFREWNDAELAGFEADGTWIFESDDPGLLVFKGSPLIMQFELPLESEDLGTGQVAWVRSIGEDRVAFGVSWKALSFQISNSMGEHLLRSQSIPPTELERYGIHLKSFREQLRFSVVSTLEEYAQVLDLRRAAYVQAGKAPTETTPEKFSSRFDRESRILGAFHAGELVACMGLTFPASQDSMLKSEILFPGKRYPVDIPPKTSLVEAHAFCTKTDFRGGDLVRAVFEQVARCVLLSDRDWILTLSTSELWPLYKNIGFRKLGASVPVEYLGGQEHHLILLHRDAWTCGRGIGPFAWNYFYGDLVRDLIAKGYLTLSTWQGLRFWTYSLFRVAVRKRSRAQLEKKYRKVIEANRSGKDAND